MAVVWTVVKASVPEKILLVVRELDQELVFVMAEELEADHVCLRWLCQCCLDSSAEQLARLEVEEVELERRTDGAK